MNDAPGKNLVNVKVEEKEVSKDKTEKIRTIGVTKDPDFEGSIIIKTEDADGRITGYAIRKNKDGGLEGNEIRYQSDGSKGPVYQLHETDFDKLREQGVLGSYERAVDTEESKKINDVGASLFRLFMEGDKIDPTWGKDSSSLIDPVRETLKNLSDGDQEKAAIGFFDSTIGRNISNNRYAYNVYRHFKGTTFGKKFGQLEDERLKKAGYASGFIL